MQSRHKMADIYLNHLHDKRMFAMVYRWVNWHLFSIALSSATSELLSKLFYSWQIIHIFFNFSKLFTDLLYRLWFTFLFLLFREVVEKAPTTQSFLVLGDAYMSIQEPDRAIEVRVWGRECVRGECVWGERMWWGGIIWVWGESEWVWRERVWGESNPSDRKNLCVVVGMVYKNRK